MTRISMAPKGRFAHVLAASVDKKGLSLRDVAIRLDVTYEQVRKIWLRKSSPSKWLLRALCQELEMDFGEAEQALIADKMEQKYGKAAYAVLGRNPRIADIEDLIPQFSSEEWDMWITQMRGFVAQKRKSSAGY